MSEISKNIQNIRFQKGMSQVELAEKLSVRPPTVSEYESGESEPSIDTLLQIAEILNTDINSLVYETKDASAIRKKRLKSLFLLVFTLLLGVILFRLSSFLQIWTQNTLKTEPLFLFHVLILPTYGVLAGYTVMSASGYFLHTRSLTGKHVPKVHLFFILVLAAYYILVLPSCVKLFINVPIRGSRPLMYFGIYILPRMPVLSLLLGIALWITRPSKPAA